MSGFFLRHFSLTLFLLIGFAVSGRAETVNYQGILTNAAGDSLLSGTFDFSFAIFPSETGGTAIWSESHDDVEVSNGIYSVLLGSVTALPESIPADQWLEIEVDATTLTPRLAITADFRTISARHAENADSVNGIPAAVTPTAGHLVPLNSEGVFPDEAMPFRPDSVIAGDGLVGVTSIMQRGRNVLDEQRTLNVGGGDGITVNADNIEAVLGEDIQTAEIDDNAITTAKIAANAVTTTEILNNTIASADIAPNAITTTEIAANAVTTGKVANNTINSAKVLDGSLTTADISPDIVSSVDGVHNDGGNIDLVAGPGISITPDDLFDDITISATGGGALAGGICINVDTTVSPGIIDLDLDFISNSNCIDIDYDEVDCEVTFDFDFDAVGDNCITADWDPDNCLLTVESLLTLIEGECIEIDYDPLDCDYTISVDVECFEGLIDSFIITIFDTLSQDSTFDSEIYARSYVVTDDPESGSTTGARGHWRSDGTIELYGDGGDTVRIKPDGTLDIIQNGELVAGLDENGEFFARSFMVINAQGDTVGHFTSDGELEINGGIHVGEVDEDGHDLFPDGTWDAYQNGARVAGLDEDGEIFARSFYVLNAQGDTVAHIRGDGKIEGSRVVVSEGGETTDIQPGSVTTGNSSGSTNSSGDGVVVTSSSGGISISGDGTWTSTQNNQVVAGLDNNGEIFAKSFFVRDPQTGDTLLHLTSDGQILDGNGNPIGGAMGDSLTFSNDTSATIVHVGGVTTVDPRGMVVVDPSGVSITGSTGSHYLTNSGTWKAFQNGQNVAGLDSTGEMFAKSFEVRDSAGGSIKAHLRNDGTWVSYSGNDSIEVAGDHITIRHGGTSPTITDIDGGSVTVATGDLQNSVRLSENGTWEAWQNGHDVAGLDSTGEIHARSFFVINEAGDTLTHLTREGYLDLMAGWLSLGGFYMVGDAITGLQMFGDLFVTGQIKSEIIDPIIAEVFKTDQRYGYEPGTVLVMDPNSDTYIPCNEPYQTSVVGVVTPKAEVDSLGNISTVILGAAAPPLPGISERLEVRVKADASYGPIKRGDLLTTSATAGYAMLAGDPKLGTIVGKALESLESGKGEIKVMVTLN